MTTDAPLSHLQDSDGNSITWRECEAQWTMNDHIDFNWKILKYKNTLRAVFCSAYATSMNSSIFFTHMTKTTDEWWNVFDVAYDLTQQETDTKRIVREYSDTRLQ